VKCNCGEPECRGTITGKDWKRRDLQKKYRGYISWYLQPATEAAVRRKKPGYKARRRVVERTHSWLNRFRKLLVTFEKTEASFVELLTLAAALICWRQTIVIYG
jgi:putative transposase